MEILWSRKATVPFIIAQWRPWAGAALAATVAATWLGLELRREEEVQELRIGEPTNTIGRVLWVDDHPENNVAEARFLESQGIAVYQVTISVDALRILSMYDSYTAVISDLGRGEKPLDGFRLVEELRKRNDDTPFSSTPFYPVTPSATCSPSSAARASPTPRSSSR